MRATDVKQDVLFSSVFAGGAGPVGPTHCGRCGGYWMTFWKRDVAAV